MTELEAINLLLRAIDTSPVNDVNSNQPDAANARATLKRAQRRIQRKGWWFNLDYGLVYEPDENTQEIVVADEIARLVVKTNHNIIVRGNKLYDNCNQTYQFGDCVYVDEQMRIVPWDELPESFQDYAANAAAVEFIRDELSDAAKQEDFKEIVAGLLVDLVSEDLEQGQYNIFKNPRVIKARSGVRPYHRNSRFFPPNTVSR